MRLKNINRRKLNNKGFTLIELLAVIVILAIVMGLAANSVINSINNSRKSTLYSAAQAAANSLNTWVTEDSVAAANDPKTLSKGFVDYTQSTHQNEWICIKTLKDTEETKISYKGDLIAALGLSDNDVVIDGEVFPKNDNSYNYGITDGDKVAGKSVCSAIRYNSSIDSYEVFLVAKNRGKFYVAADKTHYAFNRAGSSNKQISD